MHYYAAMHNTEESVALFQAATDEHWGVGCARIMEAISLYNFDRHFQIARATCFKMDMLIVSSIEWFVAEKTGNIQHCIEINDWKYRAMESYMRAAPSPGNEVPLYSTLGQSQFVGMEAHPQHLQLRQNVRGLFKYAGIHDTQQAEEGYRSSAEWSAVRSISRSSADGLTHMIPEHAMVARIRATLSLSVDTRDDVELSWLDSMPPADATTLHDTALNLVGPVNPRVLVAEVLEQQGRHADAIRFAQTDLQDYHNFNVLAKVRAGRVLGRCHAAMGQHMLSVSAFDAAIELAHLRKLLLSEALSVRGRAAVSGINGTGGDRLHWDEKTGKQRLAEVMGRMQGPSEVLERVLLLQ
jgi:hypothetical protein